MKHKHKRRKRKRRKYKDLIKTLVLITMAQETEIRRLKQSRDELAQSNFRYRQYNRDLESVICSGIRSVEEKA